VNTGAPSDLLALYANQPARVRAHVAVRWRTCPFPAVASRVPEHGRILDYGCGHGALATWLALEAPAREITGIDTAADKIASAQAAARAMVAKGLAPPVFARVASGQLPDGCWDAVLFVDVLYLMAPEEQESLLRRAARSLSPGGRVIVKEVSNRPRAKALWNRMQETVSVRVLRITAGRRLRFLPPERHAAWLESEGLGVERARLDRGYAHPHHLLVATASLKRRN
jgi:2-polyprenyl-3-methyl-5-hydroxy-6-metoxy-1,4-benzoquinol methylase